MGVGAGVYMYDIIVISSRSLSHLLMSSCVIHQTVMYPSNKVRR